MISGSPRVVHLATSLAGGAGIAAWRLHEALVAEGSDSIFVTQGASNSYGALDISRTPIQRAGQKAATFLNRVVSSPSAILYAPYSRGVVSADYLLSLRPSILHVHNWYNFFDWSVAPVLVQRGVAVVVTMHDERLLTGGCHYTLDCAAAMRDCSSCPQSRIPWLSRSQRRRFDLREWLTKSQPTLVAPSYWLRGRVWALGPHLGGTCEVIPNCVTSRLLQAAKPYVQKSSRCDTIGVVLGKSPGLLQATLDEVALMLGPEMAPNVDLLAAGNGPLPRWSAGNVRHVGRIDTDDARADFWDAVDIGLFVSRSDNFPNTIIEGLSRGVPQVVPDVGGACEAVLATGGGKVESLTSEALARGVVELILNEGAKREMSALARAGANRLYSPDVIAGKYTDLYQRVGGAE